MIIYKYELKVIPFQQIEMPSVSYDLSIQPQKGGIYLWSMVDETAPLSKRTFAIFPTGQKLNPENAYFMATVQNGDYVWHIFEIQKK